MQGDLMVDEEEQKDEAACQILIDSRGELFQNRHRQ